MTTAENMQLNKTAGSRVSKSAQGADSWTLHNKDKSKKRQHGTTPTLIYPPQKLRSNNGSSSQVHANDWNDDEGLLLLLSMHGRPLGNKKHQTSATQHSLKISSSTVHHPQTRAIATPHLFITEWETPISGHGRTLSLHEEEHHSYLNPKHNFPQKYLTAPLLCFFFFFPLKITSESGPVKTRNTKGGVSRRERTRTRFTATHHRRSPHAGHRSAPHHAWRRPRGSEPNRPPPPPPKRAAVPPVSPHGTAAPDGRRGRSGLRSRDRETLATGDKDGRRCSDSYICLMANRGGEGGGCPGRRGAWHPQRPRCYGGQSPATSTGRGAGGWARTDFPGPESEGLKQRRPDGAGRTGTGPGTRVGITACLQEAPAMEKKTQKTRMRGGIPRVRKATQHASLLAASR
ncbi:uncharacterized protein ACIBXB_006905 [Morphnus guianensis]